MPFMEINTIFFCENHAKPFEARGSVVQALSYKPEASGFETR
jgi:hypothetical protein